MAKSRRTSTAPAGGNRQLLIIGAVALVALIAAAYFLMNRDSGGATVPVDISMDPAEIQRAEGVRMGGEQAPVQLIEFADYQCPACASFATFGHPLLKERLIDTGIVRLVRYDYPLLRNHQHAFIAARAARCAGDAGKYWEYHDVLYGRQPSWSVQRDPRPDFEEYAGLLGIDRREFQQCLRSDRHAEEVTRNLRLGESLGVPGTPTLMLNGQRLNVADYNDLERQIYEAAGLPAPAGAGS